MKTKLVATLAATAFLSAAVLGFAQERRKQKHDTGKDELATGKKAPDFSLKDLGGKSHALKDYKDKLIVLEWTNKDCPVWRGRMPALKETAKSYTAKGIVWLHVDSTASMDESDNADFMKKNGITDPVLVDRDGAVGHAYRAKTTPHMFIIDKSGNIAYQGAPDDDASGKKGAKAINYVGNSLDELLAGKTVTRQSTQPYGCSVKYAPKTKA